MKTPEYVFETHLCFPLPSRERVRVRANPGEPPSPLILSLQRRARKLWISGKITSEHRMFVMRMERSVLKEEII